MELKSLGGETDKPIGHNDRVGQGVRVNKRVLWEQTGGPNSAFRGFLQGVCLSET